MSTSGSVANAALLFPFSFQGGRLYIVPAVRKGHHLTVTFQLPSLFSKYREKAEDYISHLVGHEGSGSLLSALKAAGWASAISAGVNEGGYERNTALFVFEVSITLTDAGLAAAPGLQLLQRVFLVSFIALAALYDRS